MLGFRTRTQIYYIDTYERLICSESLGGTPRKYVSAALVRGKKGEIVFEDGSNLVTDTIIDYL